MTLGGETYGGATYGGTSSISRFDKLTLHESCLIGVYIITDDFTGVDNTTSNMKGVIEDCKQ